jgi:aspartate-semialdehyde dehydrogenase
LNDELAASVFAAADIRLVDDDDVLGKLAATADEVTFIQRIEPDSFNGCDFTFFAGNRELTRAHWRTALKAGSNIVDLSGEIEDAPGILIRAPWIRNDRAAASPAVAAPDLQTRAVVSAHPVAVLLAMLAERSRQVAPVHSLWATLLEPASEHGHAALEELHQQTTNLLSFHPLPTEVFGGQTAFTLAVSLGAEGRIDLAKIADTIRSHYAKITPAVTAPLALQVVQVPVFHGYALSIAVEFAEAVTVQSVVRAFSGSHLHIVSDVSAFPGNVQAVEGDDVQVLVQPVWESGETSSSKEATRRFWLWAVADNLKFAALNAIACAVELNRLRPRGGVQ